MTKKILPDLVLFRAIATEKSFTKAARKLGYSQSALSHSLRNLEEQLGIRLLSRNTRGVFLTEIGATFLNNIAPSLDEIDRHIQSVQQTHEEPAGTIRLTASTNAATTLLWPKLTKFLKTYPSIHIDLRIEDQFSNLMDGSFDAGIRLGEDIEKDMIAIPIGPAMRMVIVASPTYFSNKPLPATPKDLTQHQLLHLRLSTHNNIYAWELEKNGKKVRIHGEGPLTINHSPLLLQAALAGLGLAFVPETNVEQYLQSKELIQILPDWCPAFPGYHLYYPSKKQQPEAFSLFVQAMKYKE